VGGSDGDGGMEGTSADRGELGVDGGVSSASVGAFGSCAWGRGGTGGGSDGGDGDGDSGEGGDGDEDVDEGNAKGAGGDGVGGDDGGGDSGGEKGNGGDVSALSVKQNGGRESAKLMPVEWDM